MDYLLLIDRTHAIPTDFTPELDNVGSIQLEKNAARACRSMLKAAENSGILIKLLSGYRSREYQRELFRRSVCENIALGMTAAEANAVTARYLAAPGHSEHESGLAADFCTPSADDTEDDFGSTHEGKWLAANSPRYGFILRYPRMKEHITGIAYEPWHFRYTGLPHSLIMAQNGITLEEYLYYYFDIGCGTTYSPRFA
ncbi:D-alanyl-D-alanine carboxypeptidase [Ruminococcus sp. YE71]|uniref:M15 family metallopeptidase n=1 Tax=unclassified Ruminococcus TaxID=2608920 RepID=UPI0008873F95|nr:MULTISPECIES: M15 family metallopeptidase [unclassified Ruminococcus]SDA24019.1 D-alanyl-D-alanine carboxypeptidase [Ruminococcus sp. YE78]SFW40884.1 D-alanyl-D-alanine carboxypeptidase [Ruminococcus sp. YE71]